MSFKKSLQGNLWQANCHECSLWNICGGSPSAPCECIHTGKDKYNCKECHIICRERQVPPTNLASEDTFHNQIAAGIPLHKLRIEQPADKPQFPTYIPLHTSELQDPINSTFVGISIDKILTAPKTKFPSIRKYVNNLTEVENHFNTNNKSKYVAILNGKDNYLEALWRMPDRNKLYKKFKELGIQYITGPTFSIIKEPKVPASHNVSMILRHNRIVKELYDYDLVPIPNIYWRSVFNIEQWEKWLVLNHQVNHIAFDFSLQSKGVNIEKIIETSLTLLDGLKRNFHIFFTGIGTKNGLFIKDKLRNSNHSFSIVTGEPIMKGIRGGKKLSVNEPIRYVTKPEYPKEVLANYNLALFEELIEN
ncbi:hypothetical protein [Fodinibius halophilus]|uniref:DUF4417 domain-containing protein n=1 Tax=Fodinibius halophilus TaxID=1736908 RepID=A0A6M1T8A7_9BACT|nr:hypothetical protein [Fodinibius halophilus]NGP89685.1 hypothetical protein [Fodinibius halophilus]